MGAKTIFDTIKQAVSRKKRIDQSVKICPEHQQETLIEACDGDPGERWLFAGRPTETETIWLMGGDADEPYTDDAPERRVFDALNHETMHMVLALVGDEETAEQYDGPLRHVLPVTTYLHRYAGMSELELEAAKLDEQQKRESRA